MLYINKLFTGFMIDTNIYTNPVHFTRRCTVLYFRSHPRTADTLNFFVWLLKGTVSRDFRPSVFSSINPTYRALIHGLKRFCIWPNIRRKNRQYSNIRNSCDPAEISNRRFGPTTFFKREYPAKLFHSEISPYNILTLTQKNLENYRLQLSRRLSRRIRSHM
jgi:hypothetical protein